MNKMSKYKTPYQMRTPYKDKVICKKDYYEKEEDSYEYKFKKNYIYRVHIGKED